jgi:dipeptidyl aminopeptidase/acylaminoacyl peptidase
LQSDLLDSDSSFKGPPYTWLNEENLKKHDPATPERLANWKNAPPTLVVHSEKDYRCAITEGLATMNTLLKHGVPCRFLTFPDEGHWVVKPENSKMWHETVLDWMDKCGKFYLCHIM